MSSANSSAQARAGREWGYSRGWRLFSVIILRPLLRLLMKHRWQGKENFPRAGGVILAPNHLSYPDWPTIALFSDSYGHRYPVFMITSAVFGGWGAGSWRGGARAGRVAACTAGRARQGGGPPAAVPYDPAVPGGRLSSGRTDDGAPSASAASQAREDKADEPASGQA